MLDNEIQVEIRRDENNPNIRNYHVAWIISKSEVTEFTFDLKPSKLVDRLERVGVTGRFLVREVMSVTGIDKVLIGPHQVSVVKDPGFKWENVEPEIIKALLECFLKETGKKRSGSSFSVLTVGENMVVQYL